MSREAVNQSDNQQPITNNETQVDNQVASKVEQEKVESPKTPIMDDRATPDIDTKIPVAEVEIKKDEEFPNKGLEELSKEFEETLAKVREKKNRKQKILKANLNLNLNQLLKLKKMKKMK